jgi:hypothetical protein
MEGDSGVLLKLIGTTQIRRVTVSKPVRFSQLQQIVASMNEEGEPSIKLLFGRELLAVASDAELASATEGRKEMKLFVGDNAQAAALTEQLTESPQVIAGIHVRAITHFIVLTKDESIWSNIIVSAATLCADCAKKFAAKGYEVQTLRLVCNPFGEYLDTSTRYMLFPRIAITVAH